MASALKHPIVHNLRTRGCSRRARESPILKHGSKARAAAPDRRLSIVADGAGPGMIYVAGASWRGVPLDRPWITWEELAGGGTLRIELASQPTAWGADPG